jgi:hypothetical protein
MTTTFSYQISVALDKSFSKKVGVDVQFVQIFLPIFMIDKEFAAVSPKVLVS